MSKKILVIGSSNTDMIIQVDKIPLPGQTVIGSKFLTFAGGKGANQAVAAQRAGGDVTFLAAIGDDDLGKQSVAGYRNEGIDTESIQIIEGTPSGVAVIYVESSGENCIAVAPGANELLSSEILKENEKLFQTADVILVQLEIPVTSVETAVELAAKHRVPLILNPAPAAVLSDKTLEKIYCITPNETEAEILTGIKVTDIESARIAAGVLVSKGVQKVIVTLGDKGAFYSTAKEALHVKAKKVKAIDTTAAGDTFNGILATALSEGLSDRQAIELAVRGASLSVQKEGAINSIPFRDSYN